MKTETCSFGQDLAFHKTFSWIINLAKSVESCTKHILKDNAVLVIYADLILNGAQTSQIYCDVQRVRVVAVSPTTDKFT
jgi:hypothetical protein